MREVTVLVCVRSKQAAQTVASCAASLGVAAAVRTAVSEAEALARLAESPADVVLVDTAVSKPDSVGFTRRVLARSAHATLVLFGPEDPAVAAAAVAAGARGVLRGADQDLVSVVAKALLLLLPAGNPASGSRDAAAAAATGSRVGESVRDGDGDAMGTIVPAQRSDATALAGRPNGVHPASPPGAQLPGGQLPGGQLPGGQLPGGQLPLRGGGAAPNRQPTGVGPPAGKGSTPGFVSLGGARPVVPAAGPRRASLTERELQVLCGMADGKSNAEIGRELFVSEDTVKTHARRLFRKLGARDRAHAVAAGFRSGIVA